MESGTILGGYRIDAVAGQGGMGVVYRATQLGLDRPVALKRRDVPELLAEELRRLDEDEIYASTVRRLAARRPGNS